MKNSINVSEMMKEAAKQAIKEYEREKKQEGKKKVFHNTKLLLAHYNGFKNHVENAIDDVNKLEIDLIDIDDLDRDELYILSIKRSKVKTLIMLAHMDMALESLRKKQHKLCASEKYEALKMLYVEEIPYDKIVKHFNCGVNTPRRWINQMVNELSVMLFGIESLKFNVV